MFNIRLLGYPNLVKPPRNIDTEIPEFVIVYIVHRSLSMCQPVAFNSRIDMQLAFYRLYTTNSYSTSPREHR